MSVRSSLAALSLAIVSALGLAPSGQAQEIPTFNTSEECYNWVTWSPENNPNGYPIFTHCSYQDERWVLS